jgi:hypothetical protein
VAVPFSGITAVEGVNQGLGIVG